MTLQGKSAILDMLEATIAEQAASRIMQLEILNRLVRIESMLACNGSQSRS